MYGYNKENDIVYNNQERLDEIDNRIFERNLPSNELNKVYDPRPTHTRRTFYPIVDNQSFKAVENNVVYSQETQFNPGTSAPYSGYATFIDKEAQLKNLFTVNQKGGGQGLYIPSSNSELYNMRVQTSQDRKVEQKHELLFNDYNKFSNYNPNVNDLGFETFNNHTRQQRRNIPLEQMKHNEKIGGY
jgi:hypothetical protein